MNMMTKSAFSTSASTLFFLFSLCISSILLPVSGDENRNCTRCVTGSDLIRSSSVHYLYWAYTGEMRPTVGGLYRRCTKDPSTKSEMEDLQKDCSSLGNKCGVMKITGLRNETAYSEVGRDCFPRGDYHNWEMADNDTSGCKDISQWYKDRQTYPNLETIHDFTNMSIQLLWCEGNLCNSEGEDWKTCPNVAVGSGSKLSFWVIIFLSLFAN